MPLYDGYDDWKKSISNDEDAEDAVDGVNDGDGLPRETNECRSDGYMRHQHRMAQALENNNTEFAVGNDFDVDNVEDTTIDTPTASEKQVYINRRVNLFHHYRQAIERNEIVWS